MKTEAQLDNTSRREFLKNLPRQLVDGIRKTISGGGISALFDEDSSKESVNEDIGPRVARLDITRCLAWEGASCQLCYLACPYRDRALEMRDQKPVVIASVCDGCAMCVTACRTVNDFPALEIVPSTFKAGKIVNREGGLL